MGKTRLAIAAAADSLEMFPDGVFLVTLAGLETAALLMPEIAAVLGVREGGGSVWRSVLAYLAASVSCSYSTTWSNSSRSRPRRRRLPRCWMPHRPCVSWPPLARRSVFGTEQEWPVSPLPIPAPGVAVDGEGAGGAGGHARRRTLYRARPRRTAGWRLTRPTRPTWRRSPAVWTDYRWPSSWRRPASGVDAGRDSAAVTAPSTCSKRAAAIAPTGSRPCARRSPGATTSCASRTKWRSAVWGFSGGFTPRRPSGAGGT